VTRTTTDPGPFTVRPARAADVPAIAALIARSVHGLMADHLSPGQRQVALGTTLGVDPHIVEDGTYFVVEEEGRLAGAGGWSKRLTLYGVPTGAPRLLDPETEPARIRAFFVDPAFTRRGVATLLLERSEAEARAAGFRAIELMATPTGVAFYHARGYVTLREEPIHLADGSAMDGRVMRRDLI
jgi:GNAT superfamily N-acetyltransferase